MYRSTAHGGSTSRRTVVAVAAVLAVLAAAACGSRVEPAAQNTVVAGGGGPDANAAPSGPGGGAGEPPMFGTMENPCGADTPDGEVPDTPGITDSTIRIGVISDRENTLTPVPTIGVEESVQAFVDFCNASGGINGRTLELKKYDSQILKVVDAAKAACNDGLFALVGTGSVLDHQGIDVREGCGLPEIGAYSASPERASSRDFFQGAPGTLPGELNAGPCKYIVDQFPEAAQAAAVVYVAIGASEARGKAIVDGCEKVGMKFVASIGVPFGVRDYKPVVSELKSKGARHLTVVSVVPETLALLREMAMQDFSVDVIDLGQQYYDPALAVDPVADGALVLTNTTPFAETDSTPALQTYMEWLEPLGAAPTSLGVQAFSAGLLFATATRSLGNDLTRESLIEALRGITEWDGGGLQMPGNPGENIHTSCFLYLDVIDREFVRRHPDEGFACDPDNVVTLDRPHTAENP